MLAKDLKFGGGSGSGRCTRDTEICCDGSANSMVIITEITVAEVVLACVIAHGTLRCVVMTVPTLCLKYSCSPNQ